jgi:hypothetical protein
VEQGRGVTLILKRFFYRLLRLRVTAFDAPGFVPLIISPDRCPIADREMSDAKAVLR